mgnify:CR=1 FL=1
MPNEAMVLMNKSTCALKPWVYSLPGQELCNFLSNRSAFPTPVGVNRQRAARTAGQRSIPHTRGGEPQLHSATCLWKPHSPHPWG